MTNDYLNRWQAAPVGLGLKPPPANWFLDAGNHYGLVPDSDTMSDSSYGISGGFEENRSQHGWILIDCNQKNREPRILKPLTPR